METDEKILAPTVNGDRSPLRAQLKESEHTEASVLARVADLGAETQMRMVCALVGHSRIQTTFFGYYYCGRCGEQVGDAMASSYPAAKTAVIVGHGCATCRKNAQTLTWQDTLLSPDPFPKSEMG